MFLASRLVRLVGIVQHLVQRGFEAALGFGFAIGVV
jgi:hypothetical protein